MGYTFFRFTRELTLLLLFICISSSVWAQPPFGRDGLKASTKQQLVNADDAFADGNYYGAIPLLHKIIKEDPANVDVAYKLAKSYWHVLDYKNCQRYFEKVVDLDVNEEYPLAMYDYANVQMMNDQHHKAKRNFELFIKSYKGEDSKAYREVAKRRIEGCDYALEAKKNPLEINVSNLGGILNSPYYELGPVLLDDTTMIFSSLPSDSIIHVQKKSDEKKYLTKLYRSSLMNDVWQKPEEITNLNDNAWHSANGTFSLDRKTFYFSRCDMVQGEMECAIYSVDFNDKEDSWGIPERLGDEINILYYSSTEPSIGKSKNGQEILFFASNRPGGEGGYDIWYVEVRDLDFSEAVNIGRCVNTIRDDITPFYDMKKQLFYFSSEGHVGIGGFDIYRTDIWAKKCEVENLGYPINSSVDDMYYILDQNREEEYDDGYFVSNRTGGKSIKSETCCNDIYRFEWKRPNVWAVEGFVYEKGDTVPIDGALVSIETLQKAEEQDGFFGKHIMKDQEMYFWDIEGQTSYKLNVYKEGYIGTSGTASTIGLKNSDTLRVDLYIEKIRKNVAYQLRNIFYDYDKAALRPESEAAIDTLVELLKNNPHLKVEIGSHTDSKGNDEYNRKLSQNRAQSVVVYLIKKGINPDALVAKGYGETVPVAKNTNPDGTDNPEGRQKNRRTEFKVLGELDGKLDMLQGDSQLKDDDPSVK